MTDHLLHANRGDTRHSCFPSCRSNRLHFYNSFLRSCSGEFWRGWKVEIGMKPCLGPTFSAGDIIMFSWSSTSLFKWKKWWNGDNCLPSIPNYSPGTHTYKLSCQNCSLLFEKLLEQVRVNTGQIRRSQIFTGVVVNFWDVLYSVSFDKNLNLKGSKCIDTHLTAIFQSYLPLCGILHCDTSDTRVPIHLDTKPRIHCWLLRNWSF